jgi:DNA-binding beta-propeller fold protein YncE
MLDVVLGSGGEAPEAASSELERPFGVAASAQRILVADPDARHVSRVDAKTRRAEALACPGRPWVAPMAVIAGPDDAVYVADGGVVVQVGRGGCTAFGAEVLERPTGLALSQGMLFVVDPPRHDVVAFAADGTVVRRFGGHGEGDGELNFPTAIAAAPDGSLLIVDALNFRVARFGPDGSFLGAFGESGQAGGDLARPKAIAADALGRIYVSDAQRDEVLVYDAAGRFELAIGQSGDENGEFLMPAGVAVEGRFLYVADSYNHRVQVFEILAEAS